MVGKIKRSLVFGIKCTCSSHYLHSISVHLVSQASFSLWHYRDRCLLQWQLTLFREGEKRKTLVTAGLGDFLVGKFRPDTKCKKRRKRKTLVTAGLGDFLVGKFRPDTKCKKRRKRKTLVTAGLGDFLVGKFRPDTKCKKRRKKCTVNLPYTELIFNILAFGQHCNYAMNVEI